MGSLDRQRWDALWQRLGGNPPADAFDALLAAYGGADRHYHSDRHILACLEHFDRLCGTFATDVTTASRT
ncbi:hypothetical protein AAIH29_29435, partial [Pseudomonas aeruginosa]